VSEQESEQPPSARARNRRPGPPAAAPCTPSGCGRAGGAA
jgi:hypothetical protein